MRYAIYYTPGRNDPLTHLAASWLGRDPFTGAQAAVPATAGLTAAEIASHTASARRYGFHATLKAPFRLADGVSETELDQALALFATQKAPVTLPGLIPKCLDGFLALVPGSPSLELDQLAGEIVTQFDRFRAPLSDADIKRRNPEALNANEFRNLMQWGYPYVFESFRFHMTLTGRVSEQDLPRVSAAIDTVFADVLKSPAVLNGLALFVEPEPGAPFIVRSWHRLSGRQDRKIA